MKTLQGIHVTDEVNRYNEKITFKAMFDNYNRQWLHYFPVNANHDMTTPVGCGKLTGIYISPGKAYSTNIVYIGENKNEEKKVIACGFNALYSREIAENDSNFNELVSKLGSNLKGNGIKYFTNGCFIYEKDLVKRAFPKLCENIDDSGLIDLNLLKPILPGIYRIGKHKEFVIYAHKYFRRGFSYYNTLNEEFLKRIENLCKADIKIKIAIDTNCIGLASTTRLAKEYEYWWGPKFNDDLTEIPLGLTVHNNEYYNELMSPIKKTEFRWYEQGGRHTFECEEICGRLNLRCDESNYYGCRFIHSMVDYDKKRPVHIDGAIRAYTQDKMLIRENTTLDKTDRDAYYTKLWRIDNTINIETWKELVTHYFKDNMLIGEYFNGNDKILDEIKKEKAISDASTLQLSDFVPCYLSRISGLRFKITYHNLSKHIQESDVKVIPTTNITSDKGKFVIIESFATALHKLIRIKGFTLDIPQVEYANFQDRIYNLPLYRCKNHAIANEILLAIQDLINCMVEEGLDIVISFSLEIPYESRSVIYSFIGHIDCFYKYFNSQSFKPLPITENAITVWCNDFYKCISLIFGNNNDVDPFHLIQSNDVLVADRKYIESNYIENIVQDDKGIKFLYKLNNQECELFNKYNISSKAVFIEKDTMCSKCKRDYLKCNCVLYKDKGVNKIIKKADLLGYIWAIK